MKRTITAFVVLLLLAGANGFAGTCKDVTGPFNTVQDVTKKCLECHAKVGDDILKSRHWTWLGEAFMDKGKKIKLGKLNILNNFCVAVTSNWPRCTSCHIGYGWKDKDFDFTKKENIDCLVCHEQTGTYKKFPTGAGYPVSEEKVFMGKKFTPPDLLKIARSVGKPTRRNCGACHFFGGGGDGVKHGDMDSSLGKPSAELDVHMGGAGFACIECHKSKNHIIAGALHGSIATGENHFGCTQCHETEKLHAEVKMGKLYDKHVANIYCQTCHIPAFARELPTKMWWDWSTAGQDKKGPKDEYGKKLYVKKKGSFKWGKNVEPEYLWYNGKADYYTLGQKIEDPKKVLSFNTLNGDIRDTKAKIMPFKVMKGKQMYDSKNMYLIVPHLFGKGGYWKTWDWNKSFVSGMKMVGLDYSGVYDWVETEMYWPINHMVAPKASALKCVDCHGEKGRFDWKALGYEKGDPKKNGGRAKNKLI